MTALLLHHEDAHCCLLGRLARYCCLSRGAGAAAAAACAVLGAMSWRGLSMHLGGGGDGWGEGMMLQHASLHSCVWRREGEGNG